MRLQVLGDRLLLKPNQLKKQHQVEGTDLKIEIAYGEKELQHEAATTEGTVEQVGPLAYNEDSTPWCSVGDRVTWGKFAGYWITDPETKENYVILDPHDILCVIKQETV
jgi:co-chaperonin GroES (HSP10)